MKRGLIVLLAAAMGAAAAVPVLAHDGMDMGASKGADTSIQGEIVDLACYLGHGAKGDKHASCAKGCIKGGSPMGLVTDSGSLYVLVNDHAKAKAFKAAQNLGGEMAKITGHQVNEGGLQAFIVEKAEAAHKGSAGK